MKPKTTRAERGVVTLKQIAEASGISYKTVKEVYGVAGAPAKSEPIETHVRYVKAAASGAVKLPPDLANKMVLLKYEKAKHSTEKEKEWAEEKRLRNLERKGKLVERDDVRAQGAAVGVELSSIISAFEKDGPALCVGKSEVELNRIFAEQSDKLRDLIRSALKRLTGLKASENDE